MENPSKSGPKLRPRLSAAAFAELPDPPDTLGEHGQAEWFRAGQQLVTAHRLSRANISLFAIYCGRFDAYAQATALVESDGLVTTNEKGSTYIAPAVNVQSNVLASIERIAKEFGLTPASESRLPQVAAPVDELEAFKMGL